MLRRALGRLRTTLGPESEDSVSRLAARKTWRQASVKFEEQRALWRPVLAHYLPYRLAVVPRNLPRPLSQVDQIRRAIRLPVPTCLPSLGNPRLHDEVFGNWKGGQLVNWRSKYHAAYHHERLEWVGDRILNATAGTLVFVLAPVKELAAPGANPELLWLQTTNQRLCSNAFAADLGRQFGFDRHVIQGARRDGNYVKDVADRFEAFVAALWLEKGQQAVLDFLAPLFYREVLLLHPQTDSLPPLHTSGTLEAASDASSPRPAPSKEVASIELSVPPSTPSPLFFPTKTAAVAGLLGPLRKHVAENANSMVLRLPEWPKVPVTKLKGQALSTTLVLACIKKGIIVIKASAADSTTTPSIPPPTSTAKLQPSATHSSSPSPPSAATEQPTSPSLSIPPPSSQLSPPPPVPPSAFATFISSSTPSESPKPRAPPSSPSPIPLPFVKLSRIWLPHLPDPVVVMSKKTSLSARLSARAEERAKEALSPVQPAETTRQRFKRLTPLSFVDLDAAVSGFEDALRAKGLSDVLSTRKEANELLLSFPHDLRRVTAHIVRCSDRTQGLRAVVEMAVTRGFVVFGSEAAGTAQVEQPVKSCVAEEPSSLAITTSPLPPPCNDTTLPALTTSISSPKPPAASPSASPTASPTPSSTPSTPPPASQISSPAQVSPHSEEIKETASQRRRRARRATIEAHLPLPFATREAAVSGLEAAVEERGLGRYLGVYESRKGLAIFLSLPGYPSHAVVRCLKLERAKGMRELVDLLVERGIVVIGSETVGTVTASTSTPLSPATDNTVNEPIPLACAPSSPPLSSDEATLAALTTSNPSDDSPSRPLATSAIPLPPLTDLVAAGTVEPATSSPTLHESTVLLPPPSDGTILSAFTAPDSPSDIPAPDPLPASLEPPAADPSPSEPSTSSDDPAPALDDDDPAPALDDADILHALTSGYGAADLAYERGFGGAEVAHERASGVGAAEVARERAGGDGGTELAQSGSEGEMVDSSDAYGSADELERVRREMGGDGRESR